MIIEVNTCITVMRFTYKLKDIHFRFLLVLGFLEWILSNVSNDMFTKGWDSPPICSSLAICVPLSTLWLFVERFNWCSCSMIVWLSGGFAVPFSTKIICCYHLIMFLLTVVEFFNSFQQVFVFTLSHQYQFSAHIPKRNEGWLEFLSWFLSIAPFSMS